MPIFLALLVLAGCTTDFDLTADYEEVMVVYGLLNQSEQDHYLRIHKGYLDEQESALNFSGNPDSIYYGDYLNVTIAEKNNTQILRQWDLTRINGDTLSPAVSKDSGTFASSPNILYHFSAELDPDRQYELNIENTRTGKEVTAATELVHDFTVQFPNTQLPIPWTAPNQYNLRWQLAENSEIYDLKAKMYYSIANVDNPLTKVARDSIEWYVFKNIAYEESTATYMFHFDNFLQTVSAYLDPDPSVVRYFDSLSFTYTVGTPVFSDYISFSIAQSGITEGQASSRYTNLDGAYGIFSGRYDKTITGVDITSQTQDTLACGTIAGHLQFAASTNSNDYPFCD